MGMAYAPYSKVTVGAALLCEDGEIYKGCNVENASYGLTVCAERTAIVKAVSEGKRAFKAIVVCSNMEDYTAPCGACRQSLAEFGLDWHVYCLAKDRTFVKKTVKELLPCAFTSRQLPRL